MELDLSNFNIRKTSPIILGNDGLPKNVERYTVKGQGILGIEIFKDDKIKIINLEGAQELELTSFDTNGENKSLIQIGFNKEANFIKYVLKNRQLGRGGTPAKGRQQIRQKTHIRQTNTNKKIHIKHGTSQTHIFPKLFFPNKHEQTLTGT